MKMTMVTMAALCLCQSVMAQNRPAETNCIQSKYKSEWGIVQCVAGSLGDTRISTAFAIGTFDKDQRVFLTPRHAVEGAAQIRLMGRTVNADATVIAQDERHDVAVLVATVPADVRLVNLRLASQVEAPEQPDQPVQPRRWDGFSPGQSQLRRAEPYTYNLDETYLWSRAQLESGMSGGIVDSADGSVQGMIVAQNRSKGWGLAINSMWLRDFLARNLNEQQLAGIAGEPITLSSDWQRRDKIVVSPKAKWTPVSYHVDTPLLFKP